MKLVLVLSLLLSIQTSSLPRVDCPAWLEGYVAFHRRQRSNSSAKYLVFSVDRFQGGLGDRVRAMLLATRLAMASSRAILITWASPFELTEFLLPSLIDWRINGTGFDPTSDHPRYHWMVGQTWRPLDLVRTRPRDFVLRNGISFLGDRYVVVSTNEHASTKCQGCPDIDSSLSPVTSCLFRYLFQFNRKVEDLASHSLLNLGLKEGEFVGLHLRLGGLVGEPLLLEEENPRKVERGGTLTRLLTGISCARKEAGGTMPVLVVSDNLKVRDFIRGGNLGPGFLASNFTPVHLDLATSAPLEDHYGTFVEALMLSKARCLLLSPKSGFSMVSLWQQGGRCWKMMLTQTCD